MEYNFYFNTSLLTLITDSITAASVTKMLVFFSLSEDQFCNNRIRTLRFDKTVLKITKMFIRNQGLHNQVL